jgi:hypothetical protein
MITSGDSYGARLLDPSTTIYRGNAKLTNMRALHFATITTFSIFFKYLWRGLWWYKRNFEVIQGYQW